MKSRWTGSTQNVDKQEVAEPEAQERDALEHGMQIQRAGSLISDAGTGDRHSRKDMCCRHREEGHRLPDKGFRSRRRWRLMWADACCENKGGKKKPTTLYCCIPGGWADLPVNTRPIFLPAPG